MPRIVTFLQSMSRKKLDCSTSPRKCRQSCSSARDTMSRLAAIGLTCRLNDPTVSSRTASSQSVSFSSCAFVFLSPPFASIRNCDVTEAKNPERSFASETPVLCTLAHSRLNIYFLDVRIFLEASALDSFFDLCFDRFDCRLLLLAAFLEDLDRRVFLEDLARARLARSRLRERLELGLELLAELLEALDDARELLRLLSLLLSPLRLDDELDLDELEDELDLDRLLRRRSRPRDLALLLGGDLEASRRRLLSFLGVLPSSSGCSCAFVAAIWAAFSATVSDCSSWSCLSSSSRLAPGGILPGGERGLLERVSSPFRLFLGCASLSVVFSGCFDFSRGGDGCRRFGLGVDG